MFQNLQNNVAVGYNGNQLTHTLKKDKYSLNIDYLILNLTGYLSPDNNELSIPTNNNSFTLELQESGTKVFKNRYQILYKNEPFGFFFSTPHSSALKPDLCQLHLENHLFYTMALPELGTVVSEFCNYTKLNFTSINRLDIALDIENENNFFQGLISRVLNHSLIVSGKDKKISPYFVTVEGKPSLTGFTIGARTASRYLRCYNKSLELTKKPKEYILNTWENTSLNVQNVWRFEYQLNNTFFRYLENVLLNNETSERIASESLTWGIFNKKFLLELLQVAEKNHFEIKYNTGKSQINKEKNFIVINWDLLKTFVGNCNTAIKRIKKIIEPSLLSVKRMLKSTFREYYQSQQENISHILSLNCLLDDYSTPLFNAKNWFKSKLPFYIQEFERKQVSNYQFDYQNYKEHSKYAI